MDNYTSGPNTAENLKRFFREGSVLANLIIVNVSVWLLVQVFRVIFSFISVQEETLGTSAIIRFFGVPAYLPTLSGNPFFPALRSGHRLLQRPSPGKQFPSIKYWITEALSPGA